MNCANCGVATYVVDTRAQRDRIMRRRQCPLCKLRFTTFETRPLRRDIVVVVKGVLNAMGAA